jgi:hypothetical protein
MLAEFIARHDSALIFLGFFCVVLFAIVMTVLFQQVDHLRQNVLFNNAIAIICGAVFIFIVFKFAGENVTILGKTIDLGLILFLGIGIFIVFILGD